MSSEDNTQLPLKQPLKQVYDQLFGSGASLSKLKDAALMNKLYTSSREDIEVTGRSLAWKLFLIGDEPLPTSSPVRPASLLTSMRNARKTYIALVVEKMRAPDGSYEIGTVLPGIEISKAAPKSVGNLDKNNPLSLHNENPWNEWFASVEIRKTISQDVERTFPEIAFFREKEVQVQLTNILFLYAAKHPNIGYRQGMHEILAPLYYAVRHDSIFVDDVTGECPELEEICSMSWIAADSWALFDSVMRGTARWYEWREASPAESLPWHTVTKTQFQHHTPKSHNSVFIAPIVEICNRIQSTFLRAIDPILWAHLDKTGIEPQIYGIRWLRLLFTREFSLSDAMYLWDGLFACDPTLDLSPWICVAMLIRIRNELILADYSSQLTSLLRYPSPTEGVFGAPSHTSLLLRQALALQSSPSVSTGKTLIIENQNLLNIPAEASPQLLSAPPKRSMEGHQSSRTGQHSRQSSSPQFGLPEMIARGLLERGESLGINKTFMNAVSELRRNIPELKASLVRPLNSPPIASPLDDERIFEGELLRSPTETERELRMIRNRDKQLAESLGWIVDTLLQDDSETEDKQRLEKQKREALESLSYVRDVLISGTTSIEVDRLIGDEAMRNISKSKSTIPSSAMNRPPTLVSAPEPLMMAHTRPKPANLNQSRLHSHSPPQVNSLANGNINNASRQPVLAPWNYTPSSFSDSTIPSGSGVLPRFPPPTSTGFVRKSSERPADQTPSSESRKENKDVVYHDPLGALG